MSGASAVRKMPRGSTVGPASVRATEPDKKGLRARATVAPIPIALLAISATVVEVHPSVETPFDGLGGYFPHTS